MSYAQIVGKRPRISRDSDAAVAGRRGGTGAISERSRNGLSKRNPD
jgi:hypothetical protein